MKPKKETKIMSFSLSTLEATAAVQGSLGKEYKVHLHGDGTLSCTCEDFKKGSGLFPCKHLIALNALVLFQKSCVGGVGQDLAKVAWWVRDLARKHAEGSESHKKRRDKAIDLFRSFVSQTVLKSLPC